MYSSSSRLAQRRGDDALGSELLEQPVDGDRVEPGLDRELLEKGLGRDRDPGAEDGALLVVVLGGALLGLDLGPRDPLRTSCAGGPSSARAR